MQWTRFDCCLSRSIHLDNDKECNLLHLPPFRFELCLLICETKYLISVVASPNPLKVFLQSFSNITDDLCRGDTYCPRHIQQTGRVWGKLWKQNFLIRSLLLVKTTKWRRALTSARQIVSPPLQSIWCIKQVTSWMATETLSLLPVFLSYLRSFFAIWHDMTWLSEISAYIRSLSTCLTLKCSVLSFAVSINVV